MTQKEFAYRSRSVRAGLVTKPPRPWIIGAEGGYPSRNEHACYRTLITVGAPEYRLVTHATWVKSPSNEASARDEGEERRKIRRTGGYTLGDHQRRTEIRSFPPNRSGFDENLKEDARREINQSGDNLAIFIFFYFGDTRVTKLSFFILDFFIRDIIIFSIWSSWREMVKN